MVDLFSFLFRDGYSYDGLCYPGDLLNVNRALWLGVRRGGGPLSDGDS